MTGNGIRTKTNGLADSRVRGGIRFGVGPLAHLLKNRFYIGEVVYRGEVHRGEHEPILARDLFDAVQTKLAANAVARQVRLKGSAAILTGRIFDDRGNRMSPTHSSKHGVRYRYYVSQPILQSRKAEAGIVARVPAPEIETLVLDGVRKHLTSAAEGEHPTAIADRDLIERQVGSVIVKPQALEVCLVPASEASAQTEEPSINHLGIPAATDDHDHVAMDGSKLRRREGRHPCAFRKTSDEGRKSRCSAHRNRQGPGLDRRPQARSNRPFVEIAKREGQGERHIRLLAPLAFVSPRIVPAIVDGTAPAHLTVTGLANKLPCSWGEQERGIGLVR